MSFIIIWSVCCITFLAVVAYLIKEAIVDGIGLHWYKKHKAQLLNGETVEIRSIKDRIGIKWFIDNKFALKGFAD